MAAPSLGGESSLGGTLWLKVSDKVLLGNVIKIMHNDGAFTIAYYMTDSGVAAFTTPAFANVTESQAKFDDVMKLLQTQFTLVDVS